MIATGTIAITREDQANLEWEAGRFPEALRLIEEELAVRESSSLWNNWASVQFRMQKPRLAEAGFRRALAVDGRDAQAAANLGALLASQNQSEAAVEFLETALRGGNISDEERALARRIHMQCRLQVAREGAERLKWFHSIDLGYGVVTKGRYDTSTVLDRIKMPRDLTGLSVLDVGAWDGYFSFEAERRGASRVLALDGYVWLGKTWASKAGFEFARKTLGSKVEDINLDVMDISPEKIGTFDVVLFLGVLYHLKHPLLALERLRSVTKKLLIVETHVDLPNIKRPAMAFYPGRECSNDDSNWWGPNEACCVQMLETAGFRNVRTVGRLQPGPVASQEEVSYARVGFHAEV